MKNAAIVALALGAFMSKLVVWGFGIGVGFWLSRTMTNKIDAFLAKRKLTKEEKKLAEENPEAFVAYVQEIAAATAPFSGEEKSN